MQYGSLKLMLKITNDMTEVKEQENTVAYFTATWCQPCKALKPQFAKAGMSDNEHNYFVIDVDQIDSSYLEEYNIKSVPTIFQLNKGVVERRIASRTAEEIIEEVSRPF